MTAESAAAEPLTFALHPQQGATFTTKANEILYGGAAGGGKALDVNTPIPTPGGWTTMGALAPGDWVFGRNGRPCQVQAVSEVHLRFCYRAKFDDDSEIIAADTHQWLTLDAKELAALTRRTPEFRAKRRKSRQSRKSGNKSERFSVSIAKRNKDNPPTVIDSPTGKIRTTQQIAETLKTKRGRANHAVPVAAPLQGAAAATLPVPPYTLGLWLGDGTASQGAVTMDPEDMRDIEGEVRADGFKVSDRASGKLAWGILGLQKKLRINGLINDKKIPAEYLRAAESERIALLQGLMDADGHAKASGGCEFTTTNERLATDFVELVNSLGCKAMAREGKATLNGKIIGRKWRVNFTPQIAAFRLRRKAERQTKQPRRTTKFRYFIDCEPLGVRRVKCIQVDSADRLFLAGRAMIPTHNSHLMRVSAITWCLQVPGLQVYLFRRQYPDLKSNHMEGPSSFHVMLAPLVAAGTVRILESKGRILFENGATIHLCHLQQKKHLANYQGAEIHVLLIDELTHFTKEMFTFLRSRCRVAGLKIPHHFPPGYFPRILCGCNPGGVGHVWVKEAFVDGGAYRLRKRPKWDGGMVRTYIPAQLSDNPTLKETDPDYENRLKGLGDPALVRAMLEGDWDIVAGAMFGEKWRSNLHTCEAFPIPVGWRMWMGADDGFAAPAACYWFAEDKDKKTIYVIAELYRAGMLAADFAARIMEITERIPRATPDGERLHGEIEPGSLQGLMDSGAFAQTGQGEISRGNQLQRAGIKFRPVEKWPGSRIHGVQNIHRLLAPNPRDPAGMPGLRFFRKKCPSAIKILPGLPRDERNPEDIDPDSERHCSDAIAYGLQFRERKLVRKRVKGI